MDQETVELKSAGKFRNWLTGKWQEHIEEIETYEGFMPKYDSKFWFNKYKYWLKAEYKRQMLNERIRNQ